MPILLLLVFSRGEGVGFTLPLSALALAISAGNPAIAYYDSESRQLWFIRANDAQGSSWPGAGVLVEAGGPGIDTGIRQILLEVEGRPAVFYQETNFSDRLIYKRADDTVGTTWPGAGMLVATITSSNPASLPVTAATDGVNTGVAYIRDTTLYYRRLSDVGGSFEAEELVNSAGALDSPSLTFVDGRPALSYYEATLGDLYFSIKY